jgi:lysozyme
MKMGKKGIDLIKHFEGFRSTVYRCAAGIPTLGFGSTHGITMDSPPITEEEGIELLMLDIAKFERAVERLITAPLNQNQFDALVSFSFNLGSGSLQNSTLRRRVNRSEYERAAEEFPRWVFAGGRKLKGLVRRRYAERELFLTPI